MSKLSETRFPMHPEARIAIRDIENSAKNQEESARCQEKNNNGGGVFVIILIIVALMLFSFGTVNPSNAYQWFRQFHAAIVP